MQGPYYHNNMMENFPGKFQPKYNQNNRFSPSPGHQHMQRHPFNRNRAPFTPNRNEDHWCETCDRGFYSSELLEQHKQQHQKCNIDGCQFIAHPKVITKHIQMQHASGLYKKISKLNNPEEIQKWRDERKKRYPTKENIDKKAAEIKEKIDRGEKMGLNRDKNHRQFNKGNPTNRRHPNEDNKHSRQRQHIKPNNNKFNKTKKPILPKKNQDIPSADNLRKLKPFAGIQDIVLESSSIDVIEEKNCDFVIEDDDSEVVPKPVQENSVNNDRPIVCGALSSLMCEYDFSDDDEVNDTKVEESIKSQEIPVKPKNRNNVSPVNENVINVVENNQSEVKSDDDGPEEQKIEKSSEQKVEDPSKKDECAKMKKKTIIEKKPFKKTFTKPKHKIPSTLLQKLLRREVQQERNIILQCVRHIIKNQYFDEK